MKFLAFITILTCSGISAKADTIDYWHVYYNDKKLKELTYYTKNVIAELFSYMKRTGKAEFITSW